MKHRKFTKIFTLVTMFIILVAAVSTSTASAETIKDCKQWHTVKSGEYLTLIAKPYGVNWRTIAEINNIQSPYTIYPGQKLCLSTSSSVPYTPPVSSSGVKVYATSVREDKTVTLQGKDLTPLTRYEIYLSNEKVANATRLYIGTVLANKDGDFKATFNIPKKLYDVSKIKVMIINSKGNTAMNWFFNATLDGNTGGIDMPELSATVESVKADKWVKIKVNNLPANITFSVYIGKAGSTSKGILVGSLVTKKGGSASATFDIPSELKGRSNLDLRVEFKPFDMVTHLTFQNKTK
jgi:LysM repeat protein